jgi:hypothetical protein
MQQTPRSIFPRRSSRIRYFIVVNQAPLLWLRAAILQRGLQITIWQFKSPASKLYLQMHLLAERFVTGGLWLRFSERVNQELYLMELMSPINSIFFLSVTVGQTFFICIPLCYGTYKYRMSLSFVQLRARIFSLPTWSRMFVNLLARVLWVWRYPKAIAINCSGLLAARSGNKRSFTILPL